LAATLSTVFIFCGSLSEICNARRWTSPAIAGLTAAITTHSATSSAPGKILAHPLTSFSLPVTQPCATAHRRRRMPVACKIYIY